MPGFVYGNGAFLLLGCNLRSFFQTADDTIDSIHEVLPLNAFFVFSGVDECGLVTDIGYICARKAGGLSGQKVYIDRIVYFYIP